MATKTNITRFKGDTYTLVLNITDSNGDPVDLTGKTLTLSVTTEANKGTTTYEFQVTGVVIGSAADGVIGFTPVATDVDIVGDYQYDVEMKNTSGGTSKQTILYGRMTFLQDVTQ